MRRTGTDAVAHPARAVRAAPTRSVRPTWQPSRPSGCADEDVATLWPRGCADVPTGVTTCADCWDELRGLYEDHYRWDREVAPMLIIDIMDGRETNDDCHLTHSVAALEA